MTAPKAPPQPIPEVPPETKPDGENVKWVAGLLAMGRGERGLHLDQWVLAKCPGGTRLAGRKVDRKERAMDVHARLLATDRR